ncbi:taste receptor type 1 member 3 [Thalassophryne amazonica]|uniref:taste receptor type 1 member 3 n=1 Tax=Thalassophryne amazonica TaxID=390379 RepID=UPI001471FCFA|nr:taste receptor type 1 member 3 [Thalassophryne amazonica]
MPEPLKLLLLCWVVKLSYSVTSPEWFQNISTDLFNLPGDILLGGLFPINRLSSNLSDRLQPDNISCESIDEYGLGIALVMKYAVDEVNANQLLLPGVKLGYEIYDTCKQSAVIVMNTIPFLTAKKTRELTVECNYTNYETRISAVIGPQGSEMVAVIAKLLGFFLMPQVSYGATSDKFSDKSLYPSFLRTVPSDRWQVQAMVELVKEFNWNWVAVVGSDEEYGKRGMQEFSKVAEQQDVCVAYQGLIPVYTHAEPVIKMILNHIKTTEVGVVIVFSLPEPAVDFFEEVIKMNMSAVWIGSTSWASHNRLTTIPNIHTVGTVIGFSDKNQSPGLLIPYTQALLTKLSEERNKTSSPVPPTSGTDVKGNPCPQCWNMTADNITLVKQPGVQNSAFSVYAAIYSVAQALHNMLGCNSTTCMWGTESKIYPWQLLEVLKNTSVDINGTRMEFDSSGDPNLAYTVFEWIWEDSKLHFQDVGSFNHKLFINKSLFKWHTEDSKMVPWSSCSAACASGQVRRVKGFHSCCFDCIDCMPGTYQAKKEDIHCTHCPERQWSHIRSTNCTAPVFDFLPWDSPVSLELMFAGLLLLICQGLVGAVFIKNRKTPMVRASGGILSFVALVSLMGTCLSLVLFLGQPQDLICRLQMPLSFISQTVALSIIMAISLQICYMTEFPEKAASHMSKVRIPGSWLLIMVCCTMQAGLCGWFVQNGSSLSNYVANMSIDFMKTFLSCPVEPLTGFAIMLGFNCAMALISFMSTFMAVKPIHQYNLARDITFASLIYCVIWVIFIPIYIGWNNQKHRSIVYISFSIASNFGLVMAYYFPKCHLLLKKPELNTLDHFHTFLEGAPPRPAQEEPQTQTQSRQ